MPFGFGKTFVASAGAGDILPRKPFPPFDEVERGKSSGLFGARLLHGPQKYLAERKESL
jgi:hypothetical protein